MTTVVKFALEPTLDSSRSPEERRSFDFFCKRTTASLASFFESTFWDRWILQAAVHEPSVFHAAVALARVHERSQYASQSFVPIEDDLERGGFALTQYNKAINALLQSCDGKPAVDVVLMTNILFACIESLQGHHGSSLAQIESGIRIVDELEWSEENQAATCKYLTSHSRPYVPLSELSVLFFRLDRQIVELTGAPLMAVRQVSNDWPVGWCDDIPSIFTSLEQARNSMDYLWCTTTGWFQEVQQSQAAGEEYRASIHTMCTRYRRWAQALDLFLATSPKSVTPSATRGVTCLRLTQCTAELFLGQLGSDAPLAEYTWDAFLDGFKELVRLAECFIEAPTAAAAAAAAAATTSTTKSALMTMPPKTNDFCLDMTIVAPLYFAAARCRDPTTRRKAISLLYNCPRLEGVWSSVLAARVAERLMILEEQEAQGQVTQQSDIPEEARISFVAARFDPEGRRMVITYARQRDLEGKLEEVFEW